MERLEARLALAAVITVNSTADGNIRDTVLTLREAILVNNRTLAIGALSASERAQVVGTPTSADADTIRFALPGGGVQTIGPTSALPTLTDPVTIDGYSQAGASANTNFVGGLNTVLTVELSGAAAGASAIGLRVVASAAGTTITGLAINRFGLDGIRLESSGNTIAGNFIGTNAAGTAAPGNGANGILLLSAADNQIGGGASAARNLISGNGTNGITAVLAASAGNTIRGNLIGTDLTGTQDLGNLIYGIHAFQTPTLSIGGSAAGEGNVISGNGSHGVFLLDNTNGATLQGNLIGVTATAAAALANGGDGVQVQTSSDTQIGGTAAGAGNVISANALNGIVIVAGGSQRRVIVQRNAIGTNFAGATLGNGYAGVLIVDASANTIGGDGGGNTIAYNGTTGVSIVDTAGIANAVGNAVLSNSIYGNADLGIDLEGNGPNFPQDLSGGVFRFGPNRRQNFPTITAVAPLAGSTEVRGVINSAGASTLRLQFFASATADASGLGEGQTFLGELTLDTDALGFAAFTAVVAALPVDQPLVTATATAVSSEINTSEFSPAFAPAAFTVTTSADSGPGSLREAMDLAGARPGFDRIEFELPAGDAGHVYYRDDGVAGQVTLDNVFATSQPSDAAIADRDPDWPHSWYRLSPAAALPDLVEPVAIDGFTQPGASANTQPFGQGLDAVPRIEISGAGAGELPLGILHAVTGGNLLQGLVINRTQGPKIYFDLLSGGNAVVGNFIGPDVSGTRSFPPPPAGSVQYFDAVIAVQAGQNDIGGTTPAARNLISANTQPLDSPAGVYSGGPNRIQGNLIGTDRAGARALANGRGIYTGNVDGTLIGGAAAEAGNVISGNQTGIEPADKAVIQNNFIGTDATGALPIGNVVGIESGYPGNSLITENRISFNAIGIRGTGLSSKGNLITRNSIHSNTGVGIDLGYDGITLNDVPPASDPPDLDDGPNALQNYPILASVTDSGGATRIEGTLQSTPLHSFRLEFFANPSRDEDLGYFDAARGVTVYGQYGEGRTWVGSLDVSDVDGDGVMQFVALVPPLPADQPFVTATATDVTVGPGGPANNTSEFSPIEPLGGCGRTVRTSGDAGVGTLREAIWCSVLQPGLQTVDFAIPGDDPGHVYYRDDGQPGQVSRTHLATTAAASDAALPTSGPDAVDPDWPHSWFSIAPDHSLPDITGQVAIDGYTQPGASRNTIPSPGGLNTVLKVELDGSLTSNYGLYFRFGAEASRVEGLAINRFPRDGIRLQTQGGNWLRGNFIGTDISGTLALPNGLNGVSSRDEAFNRVGGPQPADRNLISGNGTNGYVADGAGRDFVQGNVIGADRTLTRSLSNQGGAVYLFNSFFTAVGGVETGTGNVLLAGNTNGISLSDPAAPPDQSIDQLEACRAALQTVETRRIAYFASNELADFQSLRTSILQFLLCTVIQGWDGPAQANTFLQNHILAGPTSTGQGIDLGLDGVTANDGDNPLTGAIDPDSDGGVNNSQNFPELTSATSGAVTTIGGTLTSLPNKTFRVELFASSGLEAGGFREGETYLGSTEVTTDSSGNASFSFVSPQLVPAGHVVTATATYLFDLDNNPLTPGDPLETSELSAPLAVVGVPTVVGRRVFYNNSLFDGNNPAANAADDAAIASDKAALLPGGTATLANYTSYSKGINGLLVDVANLAGVPTAADFAFKVGNNNNPAAWSALATPPSVSIRAGAGAAGSDRITLTWPDGTITKRWLQVTLLATANTGLAANDVFYFGNAVGETGNSTSDAVVNATDEIGARTHPVGPFPTAAVSNLYDFNRDRLVNATDQIIARTSSTNPLTALRLVSVPAESGSGAAMDEDRLGALAMLDDAPLASVARRRRRP